MAYTIGLDYGTNSCRCVIVNTANGEEIGTAIYEYETGDHGIIFDKRDPNVARQNPADYVKGIETTIKKTMVAVKKMDKKFKAESVVGIGVDTTGSTPLAMLKEFKKNPNTMAWLWKDHTSHAEASEITELARLEHPEYLSKCGGVYSSEWFFSKILHCLKVDAKVFNAAYSWVECCDFITGILTGTSDPKILKRSRCAAGHKAMFNSQWGGLPAKDFLGRLDPKLGELRERLYDDTYTVETAAGGLTEDWAKKLGLKVGIPVAVGAFDAHLGAVGSGIAPGIW